MENVEVSIFDPNAVKVRGGECSSVKGGRVLAIALASHSYEVGVFPDTSIADVLSGFRLSFLIEEDNGIEVGLSPIVPYPPLTRVVWVLEVTSKGGGKAMVKTSVRPGSLTSADSLQKMYWLPSMYPIVQQCLLGLLG